MGVVLSRDQILAAADLPSEEVDVPEWGEGAKVRVRAFSIGARAAFYAPIAGLSGDELRAASKALDQARMAAFSIVGDDGKLAFTEEDIPALRDKAREPLERIANVAMRLNGLGGEQLEAAQKNS